MRLIQFCGMLVFCVLCGCVSKGELDIHYGKSLDRAHSAVDVSAIERRLYEEAERLFKSARYDKAGALYRQLFAIKEDSDYLLKLAECERIIGNYKDSSEHYRIALSLGLSSTSVVEGLILSLLQQGNIAEMIDVLASYQDSVHESWRVMNALGVAYASREMYDKAFFYYDKALNANGDYVSITNNIALSKASCGDFAESIRLFRSILHITDNISVKKKIELNMALLYGMIGDLNKAEQIASRHLSGSALYNNMGVYAQLARDKKLARAFFDKALNNSDIYYETAWTNLDRLSER